MYNNNENYPTIGEEVEYLRADENGETHEGKGFVQAIFLDPNKRLMVQVKDGSDAWNIDFMGINPTDETREAYAALIAEVTALTLEGNELVKETVSTYNDKVAAAYTAVLGAPVDVPDDVKPSEAPESAKKAA